MKIAAFFQNDKGEIVIIQPPNVLLSSWIVLQLMDLFIIRGKLPELSILATAVLFAWSYLELSNGVSPFRKALGAVVLLIILITLFVK